MVWEKFVVLSEMTSNRRAFVGENKCHEHSLLLLHPGKKKDGDKYASHFDLPNVPAFRACY